MRIDLYSLKTKDILFRDLDALEAWARSSGFEFKRQGNFVMVKVQVPNGNKEIFVYTTEQL